MKVFVLILCLALPAGAQSIDKGKDLFERRCSGCHALDKEKTGPRLKGVYGRASGGVPSFPYSDALKAAHIRWDAVTLDKWLADPDKFIPDNDMSVQFANADERAAIIGYLKQLSSQ